MTLTEVFPTKRNNKKNNNSIAMNKAKSNMFIKKGSELENKLGLLYNLTRNKLNRDYVDKLSQILYECKTIKDYPMKRINLDKAVYKYNKNNELLITLPNFYNKSRSMTCDNKVGNKNNNSIQNFNENGSNYLTTNDTNYNNSNYQLSEINRKKINIENFYGNEEEEKLNRSIKKLLLDEKKEITTNTRKLLFKQLKTKYNFEQSDEKQRVLPEVRYSLKNNSKSLNSDMNLIFPKISNDKFYDYIDIIKKKTYELDSLKKRTHKNYLSPIFFLGRNKSKYYNELKNAYKKLNKDKAKKDKIINIENKKYIKKMGNEVNYLYKINEENKYILNS